MPGKSLKDIKIDKEQIKQFWAKLNEIKVEDIIPYIRQNKKSALLAGVVVVALAGLGFLVKMNYDVLGSTPNEPTQAMSVVPQNDNKDTPAPSSTYLPETKRTINNRSAIKDPFAGSMVLKGVITGGGGSNLALIEVGNTSYVAGEGDEIVGGLVVEEVKKDLVIFKSTDGKVYLEFNGRAKSEKDKKESSIPDKQENSDKTSVQEKGGNN